MFFTFCTVGIEKVLLRRSGRILQESLTGIAVYDEVSGAYMLSISPPKSELSIRIAGAEDLPLLTASYRKISSDELAIIIKGRFKVISF